MISGSLSKAVMKAGLGKEAAEGYVDISGFTTRGSVLLGERGALVCSLCRIHLRILLG